jgi:ABC-type Fe3+/spermidine/putrescine transport system ATPase subunit
LSVRLEEIRKQFGNVVACDDITLDITQGEMFFLLGPSGCGKTTTMRIIAGLEKPDKGKVYINGEDMRDVVPYKRPTNLVFQTLALFPHLNVRKNIEYGLKFEKGLSESDRKEKIKNIVKLVNLTGLEERMPNQLSGGQQQRVALARALVKQPKVLLLDEPLTALDKKLVDKMKFELRKLQRKVGITFLNVTHDQSVTLTMASRIAIMREGRIVQIGTPEEIYEKPNSRFVADFIGEVSGFPVKVESVSGDEVIVNLDELKIRGVTYDVERMIPGKDAYLFVRPLDVHVLEPSVENSQQKENHFPAEINAYTYEGGQYLFELELGNGRQLKAISRNTRLKGFCERGQAVVVHFAKEDCNIIV